MKRVRTAIVGLGGYGTHYVNAALDHGERLGVELAGSVDPTAEHAARYPEIREKCGPAFGTLSEFFEHHSADLVVISAPIHLHAQYAVEALEHECVVLCEKPAAGSIQDGISMAAAAQRTGKPLLIGFQWSFSRTVNELRSRVADGEFGQCRSARVLGLWPRGKSYYSRNRWAGKLQASDGTWILDSPLNNAFAHFVHNPLYVLNQSPARVQAELYRANPIETFDTVALRAELSGGTELLFFASHATHSQIEPMVHYEFENHTITGILPGTFTVRSGDGSIERMESAEVSVLQKLERAVAVTRNEAEPVSTIDTSIDQLRVVAGAHLSAQPREFPQEIIRVNGGMTSAEGVAETLALSFSTGLLPSETGVADWAAAGQVADVAGMKTFTGPRPTP
jgi:predicted dehydrogenase